MALVVSQFTVENSQRLSQLHVLQKRKIITLATLDESLNTQTV